MSALEELRIRGIRSFGPEHTQSIKFSTPVTLILGPNGTGKTTIIECLKYAVTGELPPGAKTGASFIHDPKLARSVEVKAQVALKIRDVADSPLFVTRSLVATQRGTAKQPSLKTLDATIKRKSASGKTISLSSRCGEIDKEMASILGASKAVFDNVIFCHQEESNWPLLEAKSLKDRFDDLFASSRYVKALDEIRKLKTKQEGKAEIYQAELKHLEATKNEAVHCHSKKLATERELEVQQRARCEVDEKLNSLTEQLDVHRKRIKELVDCRSVACSISAKMSSLEEVVKNLEETISNDFKGTDADLRSEIERADEQLGEKQLSFSQAEEDLRRSCAAIKEEAEKKTELLIQRTQLEIDVKNVKDAVKLRNQLLRKLAAEHKMSFFTGEFESDESVSDDDVDRVKCQLETVIQHSKVKMDSIKATLEDEVTKAQAVIDDERSALIRIQQSIAHQEESLKDNERESDDVRRKMGDFPNAGAELESTRKKLTRAAEFRKSLESSDAEEKLLRSMEEMKSRRAFCETSLQILENKIVEAQRKAMVYNERDSVLKQRNAALETAKKLRSRHLDKLEQIFAGGCIPQICGEENQGCQSLTSAFVKRFTELSRTVKATQERLGVLQRELSKVETEFSFQRQQLYETEDNLRDAEKRLRDACGGTDLERCLEKLLARKKQLESDCATDEGSLHLWKKFRDRLATEADCPLCHRSFESQRDHDDLKEEIEKRINDMPGDLAAKRQELLKVDKQYEQCLELRPERVKFSELQDVELPQLKTKVTTTEAHLEELRNEIDKESCKLERLQTEESVARSLQGDMAVIEKLEKDLVELNRSLDSFTVSQDDAGSGRHLPGLPLPDLSRRKSLEELQMERESLRGNYNTLSAEIEDLQDALKIESQRRQKAVADENELKNHLVQLQEVANLDNELGRLSRAKKRIEKELRCLREQLPAREAAVTTANQQKARVVQEWKEKFDVASAEWREWCTRSREVLAACSKASSMCVSDGDSPQSRLDQVLKQITASDTRLANHNSIASTISKRIEELRTAITNHKMMQRELTDCLRLRDTRCELGRLKLQADAVQRKISELTDVELNFEKLSEEERQFSEKKHIINEKVTQLKTELGMTMDNLEKYADAERKYLGKVYELRTSEMAAKDLQRYHHALDRAIMAYHAEKMDEINQIIRELWRTTYRGNDIDYIKICSEEESTSAAANLNAGRTRRTYSYRVVMVKVGDGSAAPAPPGSKRVRSANTTGSETPLDMRGRCSAGQKVLASLVIRLALAEVFCLQCGVLALDEPTTNLDRENIESLAYALTEIIKTRSSQRNFQLIVITHDEEFIELLGRAGCAGHLQRLTRNAEGLSEINEVSLGDQLN